MTPLEMCGGFNIPVFCKMHWSAAVPSEDVGGGRGERVKRAPLDRKGFVEGALWTCFMHHRGHVSAHILNQVRVTNGERNIFIFFLVFFF